METDKRNDFFCLQNQISKAFSISSSQTTLYPQVSGRTGWHTLHGTQFALAADTMDCRNLVPLLSDIHGDLLSTQIEFDLEDHPSYLDESYSLGLVHLTFA